MTEAQFENSSRLPSRKSLRLARLAEEERVAEEERLAHAKRLEEMLERSEDREQVTSRRELRALADPRGKSESREEPTSSVKPRKRTVGVRIAAGIVALAAGVGVAAGGIGLRTSAPAQASVSLSDSVLNSLQAAPTSDTPSSLKAFPGAADAWRLRETERTWANAEPGEKCDAISGASSLASVFYDQSDSVILPLALGDYRLTSNFGLREDPFTGETSRHLGQDFGAPLDTPIYAVADGTVLHAGEGLDGRSNNLIIIQHEINGQKFTTWYVHMYDSGMLVNEGDQVKVGDKIGLVGNNGRSTGPHLHFEVHNGEGIYDTEVTDPLVFLRELGARDVADLCF